MMLCYAIYVICGSEHVQQIAVQHRSQAQSGAECAWFQAFEDVVDHGGIQPLLDSIDLFSYTCDVNTDTLVMPILILCITLHYSSGIQHVKKLDALTQQSVSSYNRKVRASMDSVDEKKRLTTVKTITRGNLGFQSASICPFCWIASLINSKMLLAKALS